MNIGLEYRNTDGQDGMDMVVVHYEDGRPDEAYSLKAPIPPWLYDAMQQTPTTESTYGVDDKPQVPNEMPAPAKLPPDNTTLGVNPPKYTDSANGNVTVNTEALRQFSTYLDSLAEPLKKVKAEVDKVSVHPGAFFEAFHLKNAVNSDPALQTNTSKALTQVIDAFAYIKRGITKLTAEYESAEELNSAGAEDLNKLLGDARTVISKMSSNS